MKNSVSIDSIYNLIKGDWYFFEACNVKLGCRPPYNQGLQIERIERIAGTDSITWKTIRSDTTVINKYLVSYSQSLVVLGFEWMLTDAYDSRSFGLINSFLEFGGSSTEYSIQRYSRTNLVTGIINKTIDEFQLLVTPNPTNGSFKLHIENEIINGEMILINTNGQNIFTQRVIQGFNQIDIRELSSGLYSLVLLSDKRKIRDFKLVVE